MTHKEQLLRSELSQKDHRIGTLEGAIEAALPYFEAMADTASSYAGEHGHWRIEEDAKNARQVIANLKGIIES